MENPYLKGHIQVKACLKINVAPMPVSYQSVCRSYKRSSALLQLYKGLSDPWRTNSPPGSACVAATERLLGHESEFFRFLTHFENGVIVILFTEPQVTLITEH